MEAWPQSGGVDKRRRVGESRERKKGHDLW